MERPEEEGVFVLGMWGLGSLSSGCFCPATQGDGIRVLGLRLGFSGLHSGFELEEPRDPRAIKRWSKGGRVPLQWMVQAYSLHTPTSI